MMYRAAFLNMCAIFALGFLTISFLLVAVYVVKSQSPPDRILVFEILVAVSVGFIIVLGVRSGSTLHLDVAIVLGLVGFLAIVAFARFVLGGGLDTKKEEAEEKIL